MILFKTIRWKNFLSTGNCFTEIKLDRSKSTLIIGENGAGKSTILCALTYSLFGKAYRKINKPQLVNSINKKELLVEVEFAIGNDLFLVKRGLKPAVFEIYKNSKLINQDSSFKDYQTFFENSILKMNYQTFCQIVILGSAGYVPFMELTTDKRRELIEELLDLKIFSLMNVILKEKYNQNKNDFTAICYQIESLNDKISFHQEHIERAKNDVSLKIDQLKKERFDYATNIEDSKEKIEKYHQIIEKLQSKIVNFDKLKDNIAKIKSTIQKVIFSNEANNKEIAFFEENDDCSLCKQKIEHSFKQNILSDKKTKRDKIEDSLETLNRQSAEFEKVFADFLNIQSNINEFFNKINHLKSDIDGIKMLISKIDDDIEVLSKDSLLQKDLEKKLEKFISDLGSAEKTKNRISDEKSILDIASFLLKDGGIKSRIIRQYVPIINKFINKYLAIMDFFVDFEIDDEFNEVIKSRFRDNFSYSSFSEGEKFRIDLAILFTWRFVAKMKNSVATNLLILDEVFDASLDFTGTEELIKIINDLTGDTNTFIISHKGDQLFDKFHSVIKFEKHKNFSMIV